MGIHNVASLGCRTDLDLDTLHEERPVSEDDEDEWDDDLAFPEPYNHSRRTRFVKVVAMPILRLGGEGEKEVLTRGLRG